MGQRASTGPRTWGPSARRSARGAAAVEFALVLPILLLVVFGIINFGFIMTQKAALANAVRAGARYATVNAYTTGHTCQSVIDKVRNESMTLGIGGSNKTQVGVTVKFTNATTNATVQVCAAPPGSANATSNGAALPCKNLTGTPATPDQLTVDSTFSSTLLVPTPGLGSSINLSGSSSFICEYYQ